MKNVRIDIFYSNGLVSFGDYLYQLLYSYEDELKKDPKSWHDITFETGNFLLHHRDDFLHINSINLNELINFLIGGILLSKKETEIFKKFELEDINKRDFLLSISYPDRYSIKISKVSFKENYGDFNKVFMKNEDFMSNFILSKNYIELERAFEITLPTLEFTEELVTKFVQNVKWNIANKQRRIPGINEIESSVKDVFVEIKNITGLKLNTVKYYIDKLDNRRDFLEEELKWLYAFGYSNLNSGEYYSVTLESLVKKIMNAGIIIHLKTFYEGQQEKLVIETLGGFETYFKRLNLINSLDDLFENWADYEKRMSKELKDKGSYRENIMLTGGLSYYQKTRFKRQYYNNPEGYKDVVLKRKTERYLGKKVNWRVNRNILKY